MTETATEGATVMNAAIARKIAKTLNSYIGSSCTGYDVVTHADGTVSTTLHHADARLLLAADERRYRLGRRYTADQIIEDYAVESYGLSFPA